MRTCRMSFPDDSPSSWGDAQEASAADLACPLAPPMLDRVVMEQELARLAERAGVWKEFSYPESGTVWCHEPTGQALSPIQFPGTSCFCVGVAMNCEGA